MASQAVNAEWRRATSQAAVLVVDDDQALAEMVAETLEAGGFEAAWCCSPGEALEVASTGRFAAAVVDLQMPGMDGLTLIDRLRSRDPDLQCLVLTGHASFDSALSGLRQGVFDYLCKSELRSGTLERRVRQAIERVRLERERHEMVVRLGTLAATSAAIAAEPCLDRLLAQLVSSARGVCRAASSRVVLLEGPPRGPWAVTASAGDGARRLVGLAFRSGEGLAALAVETRAVQLAQAFRPEQHGPQPLEPVRQLASRPGRRALRAPRRAGAADGGRRAPAALRLTASAMPSEPWPGRVRWPSTTPASTRRRPGPRPAWCAWPTPSRPGWRARRGPSNPAWWQNGS